MRRKKVAMKYVEDKIAGKVTFVKRRAGIFKKVDELAKLYDVDVGVLINSSTGQPYTYGCPTFIDATKNFLNPYPTRRRHSPSTTQIRILKSQTKLDCLMEELEQSEEHVKILKKRHEENLANYNMEKNIDLKLEDFVAFKEKLEALRDNTNVKHVEMEVSSSLLMLLEGKNENMNKKNK